MTTKFSQHEINLVKVPKILVDLKSTLEKPTNRKISKHEGKKMKGKKKCILTGVLLLIIASSTGSSPFSNGKREYEFEKALMKKNGCADI